MKTKKIIPKRNIIAECKERGLNTSQDLFCQYIAEKRQSATEAYCNAYGLNVHDKKDYETARKKAYNLYAKVTIQNRLNELLIQSGFNDVSVDSELLTVIKQNGELNTKVQAIKEYNRLKARIVDNPTVQIQANTQLNHVGNADLSALVNQLLGNNAKIIQGETNDQTMVENEKRQRDTSGSETSNS